MTMATTRMTAPAEARLKLTTKPTTKPTMNTTAPTDDRERGDAGIGFLLAIPALLIAVLSLVNATQMLYERREAWAVASAATRVGSQADPFQVRSTRLAEIDEGKARTAINRYVTDAGYTVVAVNFGGTPGAGTTVTVEIIKDIDYIFPIPTALSGTITGRAVTTLRTGVSQEGG